MSPLPLGEKTAKILDPKLPKVPTPPKTAHQKIFWPSHEKVAKKPPTSFYLIFHLPVSVRKFLSHFPEKSAVQQISLEKMVRARLSDAQFEKMDPKISDSVDFAEKYMETKFQINQ